MDHELDHVKKRENALQIRKDIKDIELVHTDKLFIKATQLFIKKWSDINPSTTEFVEYFDKNG